MRSRLAARRRSWSSRVARNAALVRSWALLARSSERLARGVSESYWRRRRLFEDVVLRSLRKLHPAVIGSVRPRHATSLVRNLVRASAGRGPV